MKTISIDISAYIIFVILYKNINIGIGTNMLISFTLLVRVFQN